MRRLRYNIAATLDGHIASSDHTTNWIIEDASIDFPALYSTFSTFIMGHKTYSTLLSYGDHNPLKDKPKEEMIVVSRSMKQDDHPGVTIVNDHVEDVVLELKTNGNKDIWLFGGGELARCLLDAKLVDAVEVAIMPVLIGDGVKMISGTKASSWKLKLDEVDRLDSGIIMTKYLVLYE
jgi:dihydrofolate reductase